MFRLSNMFSDGALFQSGSALTVSGFCAGGIVSAVLESKNAVFSENTAKADETGWFEVVLNTPKASFDEYCITLSCGGEKKVISDILFGELWLASGQSNMELRNNAMDEYQKMFERVKDKNIRMYHALFDGTEISDFPYEPDPFQKGFWVNMGDTELLMDDSAIGLMYAAELYDFLNKNADTPVGILDACWGGTPITAWLPKTAIDSDEVVFKRVNELGRYPKTETWNDPNCVHYQQTTSQYNIKIAPLVGAKVRGVIWYQGENETGSEFKDKVYSDYLRLYHKTYAALFAKDEDNFPMISALIYPGWTYGGSGSCGVGYINRAFTRASINEPKKFISVPTYDLKTSWAYYQDNHPIHPIHKYELAVRMAKMCLANVYGSGEQKAPAHLESFEVKGDRFFMKFANAQNGLKINGNNVKGLYCAGSDGVYLPASAKISGDTMEVWCDEIKEVKHAAYSSQSFEPFANIVSGDYPVLPFFTDNVNEINIESRPWYDMENSEFWANMIGFEGDKNVFFRPVWKGEAGSEVCRDSAFTLNNYSLRIEGENKKLGAYVRSYNYAKLDLHRFSKLSVNIYCIDPTKCSIVLKTAENEIELPLIEQEKLIGGWRRFEADLTSVMQDDIKEMHFTFNQVGGAYRCVNIEKIRLRV